VSGVSGPELQARRAGRLHTSATFRQRRTPLEIIAVADNAAAVADTAAAEAKVRQPPRPALACREGCAWCCYKVVGTAAPEVLRIVAYLRETLPPAQWSALRQRVDEGQQRRRALSLNQLRRAALPCPLLQDDRCLGYPVRPLTCRGYSSSDARRCEQAVGQREVPVPVYLPQQRLSTMVLDGLRAGLEESGLESTLLELTAALHLVLSDATVEERWLAGQKVFAEARLPG
jgi:hypothetical protein